MIKIIKLFAVLSVSFILINAQAGSSGSAGARETAMGGTANAGSRSIGSIGFNPANLALKNFNTVEFSTILPLPELSVYTGSDIFSIKDYNYYFGGTDELTADGKRKARVLTDDDKNNLINLFGEGDLINSEASVNLLTAAYFGSQNIGVAAFGIKDRFAASGSVDKDIVSFMLKGNKDFPEYQFDNNKMNSVYFREYSFTFAKNLTKLVEHIMTGLYAGVSIKFIKGFAYAELMHNNVSVKTLQTGELSVEGKILTRSALSPSLGVNYKFDNRGRESDFNLFPEAAGSGVGIDLGVTAELNRSTTVSLAITDIGSVKWDKETVEYKMEGQKVIEDFTQKDNLDSLKRIFDFNGNYINGFSTSLPTTLRAGFAIRIDNIRNIGIFNKLLFVVDYSQGFNNQASNSTTPRVSAGVEYAPWYWLNLRSGFSLGGKYGFRWSAGFGFEFARLNLDFTASDFNHLVNGNSARKVGINLGSKWKF